MLFVLRSFCDCNGNTVYLYTLDSFNHDIFLSADYLCGYEVCFVLFYADFYVGHSNIQSCCGDYVFWAKLCIFSIAFIANNRLTIFLYDYNANEKKMQVKKCILSNKNKKNR